MVGGEKFRRASEYWRYRRMLFESFLQKIAHSRPLPAKGMLKIFVKRQIAFIKIMRCQALRLNALRGQIKNRQI